MLLMDADTDGMGSRRRFRGVWLCAGHDALSLPRAPTILDFCCVEFPNTGGYSLR